LAYSFGPQIFVQGFLFASLILPFFNSFLSFCGHNTQPIDGKTIGFPLDRLGVVTEKRKKRIKERKD